MQDIGRLYTDTDQVCGDHCLALVHTSIQGFADSKDYGREEIRCDISVWS